MMKRNASNPIRPFPICSCRSTREPRPVFESFRCSRDEIFDSNNAIEFREHSFRGFLCAKMIVIGRKNVGRIQTNAETLRLADVRPDIGQVFEAMTEG